ncbi:hypothetical protein OS493_023440 [Desmophyllum pertusum]|uniref:Caspase-3 n=1 Tax=Desmophyllum pertusum TaxID=174260 RepID=A0A9X0D2F5_9CNID|nr:hypothetical protein OS493_023440 [Desmophyllum pertusum]
MNRPGAEADERNLKNLFKDLSFRVIVKKDLKKHEIERVAQKYGAVDHSKFDAFVFILMSHGGDRDCILGVDGRETTLKNLMFEFRGSKCPSLKNKPKVIIIQTCRGLRDDVSKRLVFSTGNINSPMAMVASTPAQIDNEPCDIALLPRDSTLPRSVFPQEADFVLAFATVPGYVSFRFPDGTFFIQALVEVMREHHHRYHFLEMLTEVTKLVVERQSNMAAHPVQVPAPMHTMTKLLYL